MADFKLFCLLVLLFFINSTFAETLTASKRYKRSVYDSCETVCTKKYPTGHEFTKTPRLACQRGCFIKHFLLLSSGRMGRDSNTTREICQGVSYSTMSKNEVYLQLLFLYIQNASGPAVLQENDMHVIWGVRPKDILEKRYADDVEPDEVLLDPALLTQLSPATDDVNRLPEMHIKTLPVVRTWEEFVGDMTDSDSMPPTHPSLPPLTYWLECVGRKPATARMLLMSVVILAVLCVLWLCLMPEPSQLQLACPPSPLYSCPGHFDSTTCHWYDPTQVGILPPSPPPKYSDIMDASA